MAFCALVFGASVAPHRKPESDLQPVLIGEKDLPLIPLRDPADVHSDDAMLSAVQAGSNRRRAAMLAQFTDDELVGELRLRRLERAAL